MQRKDDVSKVSRPSLLSSAEQAEAERSRILSTLESGSASTRGAARPGAGRRLWIGVGVAVLLVAAGVGIWWAQDSDVSQPVLAEQERDVVVTQLSAATVGTTDGAAGAAPAASTAATILDDGEAQPAPAGHDALQAMLERPGQAPSPAHSDDLLSQALEAPAGLAAAGAVAATGAVKAAPKPRPKPKARPAPKAEPAEPAPTPEQENDVVLLSALMAHATAADREPAPKKARASLSEQLAQCKKLAKGKAEQCRARVCDGRPNTGGCKVQR